MAASKTKKEVRALSKQMRAQLAEQSKQAEIAGMLTKVGILAVLLALALWELWAGIRLGGARSLCEQPLHAWLLCDGSATFVGMLLGLTSALKAMQTVRGLDAHHWLLAHGEQRDASDDLRGAFRLARTLSDGFDVALILLFACGWYLLYPFYQSGAGGAGATWQHCDFALRGCVWWALVLKLLAPIGVSLAIKGWFMLWRELPAVPEQVTASVQPAVSQAHTGGDVSQRIGKKEK